MIKKNRNFKFDPEFLTDMLYEHTHLNANKVVSYLPLNTIENVMGMPLGVYTSIIENNGGSYIIFRENECRIPRGAVYAFLSKELDRILKMHKDILAEVNIPCEPSGFIHAIADTWFGDETNMTPLIKELFGDV